MNCLVQPRSLRAGLARHGMAAGAQYFGEVGGVQHFSTPCRIVLTAGLSTRMASIRAPRWAAGSWEGVLLLTCLLGGCSASQLPLPPHHPTLRACAACVAAAPPRRQLCGRPQLGTLGPGPPRLAGGGGGRRPHQVEPTCQHHQHAAYLRPGGPPAAQQLQQSSAGERPTRPLSEQERLSSLSEAQGATSYLLQVLLHFISGAYHAPARLQSAAANVYFACFFSSPCPPTCSFSPPALVPPFVHRLQPPSQSSIDSADSAAPRPAAGLGCNFYWQHDSEQCKIIDQTARPGAAGPRELARAQLNYQQNAATRSATPHRSHTRPCCSLLAREQGRAAPLAAPRHASLPLVHGCRAVPSLTAAGPHLHL